MISVKMFVIESNVVASFNTSRVKGAVVFPICVSYSEYFILILTNKEND